MAYLRGEPGADRVEALFARPSLDIVMHAVNLLEVQYKLASYAGEATANEAMDDLAALGVAIHEKVDTPLRLRSGFFKMRYPFLSLADSICIALARQTQSTVLTSDRPFANVKDGVKLEFIR
jgi:PIN domain nuclease of toxin-antitoxin system